MELIGDPTPSPEHLQNEAIAAIYRPEVTALVQRFLRDAGQLGLEGVQITVVHGSALRVCTAGASYPRQRLMAAIGQVVLTWARTNLFGDAQGRG